MTIHDIIIDALNRHHEIENVERLDDDTIAIATRAGIDYFVTVDEA